MSGRQWKERDNNEWRGHRRRGGRGNSRGGGQHHPSGLQGKDIGMWYASRGIKRQEEQERLERPMIEIPCELEQDLLNAIALLDYHYGKKESVGWSETYYQRFHLPRGKRVAWRRVRYNLPRPIDYGTPKCATSGAEMPTSSNQLSDQDSNCDEDYENGETTEDSVLETEVEDIRGDQDDEITGDSNNDVDDEEVADEDNNAFEEELVANESIAEFGGDALSTSIKKHTGSNFRRGRALQSSPELDLMLKADLQKKALSPAVLEFSNFRQSLPAYEYKKQILEACRSNRVVVVSGATGCGKSTQIPQMILDDCIESGQGSRTFIVVTQPRRISATSLAKRVAEERGENLGESVGYQIRLEDRFPRSQGSILFCTSGIILRWMLLDPELANVSHVILDEIHERDCSSDFLLIFLRDLMKKRNDLRLILSSATLESEKFVQYFGGTDVVPKIEIPGRLFPVKELYLEEILELTKFYNFRHRLPKERDLKAKNTRKRTAADYYFNHYIPYLNTVKI